MTMNKMLFVSKGHLSKPTQQWLDGQIKVEVDVENPEHRYLITSAFCGVHAFPFDHGWLAVCVISGPQEELEKMPSDLFDVFEYGEKKGADWLQIDEDGERFDDLPFYD